MEMEKSMQSRQTHSVPSAQALPAATPQTPYALLGWITLGLPVLILLSWMGYRKYQAVARQRRIRKLERMWQMSASEKRF
jgi:hypothetical protein